MHTTTGHTSSHSSILSNWFTLLRRSAGLTGRDRSRPRRRSRAATVESLEPRELLTQYLDFSAAFSTTTAGTSRAGASAVATDADGSVYITGEFVGGAVDFDPTFPAQNPGTSAGGSDIFVSKFDAQGTLVWNVLLGGTGDDSGLSIDVNNSNQVFIAGFYSGTVDFDPGGGTQNRTSAGGKDGFVLQLNSNNGTFLNVFNFGSTGEDQATSVDAFEGTLITVTGFFNGTVDFNPTAAVNNAVSAGGDDIFLLEMSNMFSFSNVVRMGGTGSDRGAAVKYTPERDILLTGSFSGTGNFNPRSAAVNLVSSGGTDAFTARYDGAMFLKWAAKAGGTLNDTGTDIEADPTGRVVTIGNFDGTVDFDPSAATLELVSRGSSDGFVATYAAFGGLQSVQHIGGSRNDSLRSLEIDAAGNRYLAGRAENLIHFGRGNGSFSFRSAGAGDIFITKLTPADAFVYVQQLQGSSDAAPGGIALGPDSTLSLAGTFLGSMDTNPNFGAHHLSSLTSGAVIMQLSPDLTISDPVDNLGVRRNGDLLQIVRLNEEGGFNGVIEDGLLAETHSVSLDRTVAGDSRFMQVDFATGGAFTLPGGIQLAGSTNSGVTDTVHILGTGVEAVTVRPSATTHKSATVLAHNQVIALTGVEAMVTAGSQALFVEAPKSGSVWTVNQGPGLYGPGGTRVEGSSGGVEILRIGFVDVPSVTLSTERPIESLSAAADTITVTALALEAAGLKNLFVRTGRGDDTLIVNGPDLSLPTAGGAFWYLGGPGSDRLTAIADTNLDLNDARLVSGGGGRIQFDDIEKASLTGGAGNNHLNASLFTGDVTLDGAAGADLLRGGSGNDVLFGGTGNDRLFGNDGNDVLNGQDNNDLLFGGNGLDTLNGQNGNDRLYGDEDDDFLNGGANNDVLLGGNGNDTLFGGTEDDLLFGEAGDDILNGEAGNDQLDFGSDNDTGNGGAGNDLYLLYGTQNAEDLQLARNSATSATFRRKPRGLTSSLESKGITMDATDEFFIQALDGDDLIAIDTAFTQLGSVDGGNGSDTCTAPGAWTKVSC